MRRLTWWQIFMYLCDPDELGGIQQRQGGPAVGYRQQRELRNAGIAQ